MEGAWEKVGGQEANSGIDGGAVVEEKWRGKRRERQARVFFSLFLIDHYFPLGSSFYSFC